jgi:hypothetical protein
MSVSGVSSSPYATNNPRAEFERLRQAHAEEGPDAAGKHRRLRGNDGQSAAASALAGLAPDPDAAQKAALPGKVDFSV